MSVDLRLVIPATVAWIAVGVAIAWPGALAGIATAAWGGTVGLVAAAAGWRRHPALVIGAVACCAAALVLTSAAVGAANRRPDLLVEAAGAGRFVQVTAVTTQAAFADSGSFAITVTEVAIGDVRLSTSVPARLFGSPPGRGLGVGVTITVGGRLSATAPEDDIAFLLITGSPPVVVGPSPWYLDWANGLRDSFRSAAAELPGDGGALLPGLAIGDTSAVGDRLDSAMKSSSLSHLTAVSGANCAVVIGLIMIAGGALGIPMGWRIASSIAVLVGFVILVTPEPSVLRAAVMAVLVLVSIGTGRPARGVPILSVAVLGLLVGDPWLARSYGFVLSVLATAGLLVLAAPLTTVLARWLPTAVAAVIAIPLAAQLAVQPVLILLNASIPTYGVVANMLVGPAAPVATVLGLIACLVLPWAPGVGMLIAQVAWMPAAWIAAVATFFAELPGNRIPWLDGAVGVALITVVTVLALLLALGPRRGIWRIGVVALLSAIVGSYVGVIAGSAVRTVLSRPGDWQYAACGVGQGDALVVRSAARVAVIDTGPEPAGMSACLDELGISRIDLLVITHFDLDHIGGASAILDRVDRVLIGPIDRPQATRLVEQLRGSGARVEQAGRGQSGDLGELRWTVLWPPAQARGIEPGNDSSVVLAFAGVGECAGGCLNSVFLGDVGEQSQAMLLTTNRVGPVDVVKVAHHGSADQNQRLYERLDATVGLIAVGVDNSYGHPTARLLEILAATGTAVARTDVDGLVLVAPGASGGVVVWRERGG